MECHDAMRLAAFETLCLLADAVREGKVSYDQREVWTIANELQALDTWREA